VSGGNRKDKAWASFEVTEGGRKDPHRSALSATRWSLPTALGGEFIGLPVFESLPSGCMAGSTDAKCKSADYVKIPQFEIPTYLR
jgi:hypothetical protein